MKNDCSNIIAVATDKGGTGKTTFAINLAAVLDRLAELGEPRDVLLVDADSQYNTSQCLLPGRPPRTKIYHSLMDETVPDESIREKSTRQ